MLFIAVRCVCGTFQVIQEPKSKKYNCRACTEKNQSVRKVYAKSHAAKDVREVVMSLNMSRSRAAGELPEIDDDELEFEGEAGLVDDEPAYHGSKWQAFVDAPHAEFVEEREPDVSKTGLVLE